MHAPAIFEFRSRRDFYFPFLGTSGDVPITPLYEYFPIGFKTLQRFLGERGHRVALLNLSSLFLLYPHIELRSVAKSLDVKLVGIDLHWMVHVQGSLAVAEEIKEIRPGIPIIFGGISSTYYADQLMEYPFVDMVMRGYDTHQPMAQLMEVLKAGKRPDAVPNLLWKCPDGLVRRNGYTHTPATFGCGVDWSTCPPAPGRRTIPIRELLSTHNTGCSFNCGWCGGSREAFQRVFKRQRSMAHRPPREVDFEFETMRRLSGIETHHLYLAGSYNETRRGLVRSLDLVRDSNLRSVCYEQFHLTPDRLLKRMASANKHTTITLSPQSHNLRVAKLAGRGAYTNEQMEAWLDRALSLGIHQVDIWYLVGLPEQDERSVMETADYCERLLEKFQGTRVNPMICPMIPFLDPASTFFEHPHRHGYRVFYRSLEEHRRAMTCASILNRINYETRQFSRSDLVRVGFTAVQRVMQAKAETGFLPRACVEPFNQSVADAMEFIEVVHAADCIVDEAERRAELAGLGDEILRRNDKILFGGVQNQALPFSREIGGRWFDELGWSLETLENELPAIPKGTTR